MLDNQYSIDRELDTVGQQLNDPDTFAPGDFYNFIRESETIKMIEKDIQEEVNIKC